MTRLLLTLTAAAAVALTTVPASASYGQPCIVECLPCTDGTCWEIRDPCQTVSCDIPCIATPDTVICF